MEVSLKDLEPVNSNESPVTMDDLEAVDAPNNSVLHESTGRVLSIPQTLSPSETELVINRDIDKKKIGFAQQPINDVPLPKPESFGPGAIYSDMFNNISSAGRGAMASILSLPAAYGGLKLNVGESLQTGADSMFSIPANTTAGMADFNPVPETDFQEHFRKAVGKVVADDAVKIIAQNREYMQKAGWAKREGDGIMYDIGNGTGSIATALAVSGLTKSPSAAAALFGAIQKSSIYVEARESGMSPEAAAPVSTVAGMVEAALEKVGIDYFLKGLKSNTAVKRFATGFVTEFVQEGSQQAAEEGITNVTGIRNETKMQIAESILYNAALGGIIGGPTNAAIGAFVKQEAISNGFTEEEAGKLSQYAADNIDMVQKDVTEFINKEVAPIASDDKSALEFMQLMQKFDNKIPLQKEIDLLSPDEKAVFDKYVEYFKNSTTSPEDVSAVEKAAYDNMIASGVNKDWAVGAAKLLGARSGSAARAAGITPMEWYKSRNLKFKVSRTDAEAKQVYKEKLDAFNAEEVAYVKNQLDQVNAKDNFPKQPLLNWIKKNGGIKSDSTVAQELRAMGISNRKSPGLFRNDPKKHIGELDNIPIDEFNKTFGITAKADETGNYVDRNWLLSAIESEQRGKKITANKEVDKSFIEALDKAGLDPKTASPDQVLMAIGPEGDVIAQAASMGENINSDQAREILGIQQDNPSYSIKDAIEHWVERESIKTLYQDTGAKEFGDYVTKSLEENIKDEVMSSSYLDKAGLLKRALEGNLSERERGRLPDTLVRLSDSLKSKKSNTLYQSINSNGFYSSLQTSIEDINQNKGSPEQWAGIINNLKNKGVKQEEIDWTGIQNWLKDQNSSVTKEQILDYLWANQINVEEVIKDSSPWTMDFDEDQENYVVYDENGNEVGRYEKSTTAQKVVDSHGGTKFDKYTLPGGNNYRELLMTLPSASKAGRIEKEGKYYVVYDPSGQAVAFHDSKEQADEQLKQFGTEEYKSHHYSERNILAHIRFNERTDADGKRVMFIEEVQSDWHQAGRDKGYVNSAVREQMRKLSEDEIRIADRMRELRGENTPEAATEFAALLKEAGKLREQIIELNKSGGVTGVPDAPFKTSWPELAFKRSLMWAVENNFDRVAWTTGEQQAERYDLTKSIGKVIWSEDTKMLTAYNPEMTRTVIQESGVTANKLEDYLGKEVAKKLSEVEPDDDGDRSLEGLDLKVGGEGMKGFYDNILPKMVNKLVKKWGGRVGTTKIKTGEFTKADDELLAQLTNTESTQNGNSDINKEVWSLDITRGMKEAVTGGLPLFQSNKDNNDARGSIIFHSNETIINLFENANPSTLLHELGHLFLRDMRNIAMSSKRPMLARDYKAIQDFLGATNGSFTVAQEEKFARAFEAYLREGKAPKPELQGIFDKFKEWLTSIYKSIKQLDVNINDDIRNVFDRMLGGDYAQAVDRNMLNDRAKLDADYELVAQGNESTLMTDTKKVFRDVGNLASDAFVPVSTRLAKIDVKLKHAVRKFVFKTGLYSHEDRTAVKEFVESVSKMSVDDYRILDLALKNKDTVKTDELVKKYGIEKEWESVRETLDNLYSEAIDVGLDMQYVMDYFPRQVKFGKEVEYMSALRGTAEWTQIQNALEHADPNGEFTDEDKAHFINNFLRGFTSNRINLARPGFSKERTIDYVTPEMNKFYDDSMSTLVSYIGGLRHGIESRKLFGKSESDTEKNIGKYVLDLVKQGAIKADQETELKKLLKAVVEPNGTRGAVNWAKNATYIYLMGSPISDITQIQDLAFSLAHNGYYRTTGALINSLRRKALLKKEELGLENVLQEFEGETRSSKAVRVVFKAIGLEHMDNIGKEVYIEASYRRLVKENKINSVEWNTELQNIFGEEANSVKQDLANGTMSENVKYLLFSELSNVQPISLAEMPVGYLRGGNGRILYMLKTYTIKQIDLYRNTIFSEIASGEKKRVIKGINNLTKLAFAMMLMGMGSDALKDLILGRPIDISTLVADNVLKFFGFTKYQIYKTKEQRTAETFFNTLFVAPLTVVEDFSTPVPVTVLKDITQDVGKAAFKDKPLSENRIWSGVPVVGKFYYWWWGGGRAKIEKQKQKSGD